MNSRFLVALFALSLASSTAACSSSDGAGDQAATPTLDGVYRPVDQGTIGSITFSGGKDYLLMPKGCASAACADIGTYRLDVPAKQLVLENAATHATQSMAFEIVDLAPASGSLVQSVRPQGDLVDPGTQLAMPGQQTTNGSQMVTGNQQQLATGGNPTTGAASQLLQLITQALMNAQQMQNDQNANQMAPAMNNPMPAAPAAMNNPMPAAPAAAAPAMNDPMNDCKQGVPTKDTPLAQVAAYFARCPAGP